MTESIDEHFLQAVAALPPAGEPVAADPGLLLDLFDAQLQSRHLDFAARWLQARGEGFYTIGSAGHEANAALGLLSRRDDPALLHYRSGGFFAARALRHPEAGVDPIRAVLLGLAAAADDPISAGRHKVFGHRDLHVIPQTSTIASHLPRAVGLAYAIGNLHDLATDPDWPADAVVLCSFGDASANHSTARGALNAAGSLAHRGLDAPVLFVCEDNGLGISTRTPAGWTAASLRSLPGVDYLAVPEAGPDALLARTREALDLVRTRRRPAVLHLSTVRFLGHAGSDVEQAYRSRREILADHARDPLLATARALTEQGVLGPAEILRRYESMRERVAAAAQEVLGSRRLDSRAAVMAALPGSSDPAPRTARPTSRGPGTTAGQTLSQVINAELARVLQEHPGSVVFGEDVAVKGGVYGVTRGLRQRFGGRRVFDTLLDEQTILGTALGLGLSGLLPIPEIQYLAYLHNAEDQLRGEAASLSFFSDGRYRNPMVLRIAGLAYQRGFGGHFHNDNSVAVLRDLPGVVLCVPSHPTDAGALLRECVDLAEQQGRVCVYLEPIALYHARDLHRDGDGGWLSEAGTAVAPLGSVRTYGDGRDLLVVTFGNGVPMSLRATRQLAADGVRATVLDLRWLAPLSVEALVEQAAGFSTVLVADETRHSGGVGEAVLAALVEAGHAGRLGRVASADSFVPLGPAAGTVLLDQEQIVRAARDLLQH